MRRKFDIQEDEDEQRKRAASRDFAKTETDDEKHRRRTGRSSFSAGMNKKWVNSAEQPEPEEEPGCPDQEQPAERRRPAAGQQQTRKRRRRVGRSRAEPGQTTRAALNRQPEEDSGRSSGSTSPASRLEPPGSKRGGPGPTNTCAACLKPIRERYLLEAMDKQWHEDCLKCACCDCRLGEVGSSLFTHSDKILCRRDFLRIFGQQGHCAACKRSIPPYELVMRANENAYHMDCFNCQQCQYRFCVGDRFHLTDSQRIVCLLCHAELASQQQQHSGANQRPASLQQVAAAALVLGEAGERQEADETATNPTGLGAAEPVRPASGEAPGGCGAPEAEQGHPQAACAAVT